MALASLDLRALEQGQGAGDVTNVAGNPTANPITRQSGFTTTPIVIGNADGYDLSSSNALRLFWDAALDGGASLLKLYVVPAAASPGSGGIPAVTGAQPFFPPAVPVLKDVPGPVTPADSYIEITAANLRRGITIPRPSLAVRFEVASDTVLASSAIALAVQSILSKE